MVTSPLDTLLDDVSPTAPPDGPLPARAEALDDDGLARAYRELAFTAELLDALDLDPERVKTSALAELLAADAERAAEPTDDAPAPVVELRPMRVLPVVLAIAAAALFFVADGTDDDVRTKGAEVLEPRVVLEVEGIDGPMTPDEVKAGVSSVGRALDACATGSRVERVDGSFRVGGDGVVATAHLRSALGGSALAQCVDEALRGASFPLKRAPSEVTVRLQLHRVAP